MRPYKSATKIDERVHSWGQALDKAVGGILTHVQNPEHFNGDIMRFNSHGMEFTKLDATGMMLQRSVADIDKAECKYFFLIYQRHGNVVVEQDDKQTRVKSGDIVLLDSAQPFRIDYSDYATQYCFHIPRDKAGHSWRYARVKLAEKISANGNLASLLTPLLRETARSAVTTSVQTQSDHLLNATLSLLQPLFTQKDDYQAQHRTIYLQRAMTFIEAHLCNEDLCPQLVADHLGVSPRHLQRLFKPLETSVSKLVLEKRINACATDLSNPENVNTDVTVIAFYWGFKDTSYFSRVFKNYYGITPSQYRMQYIK